MRFFCLLVRVVYFREVRLVSFENLASSLHASNRTFNPTQAPNRTPHRTTQAPKALPLSEEHSHLLLLSHRNGALDGWVYAPFIPRFVFTLSSQLHKSFFLLSFYLRAIFQGITLVRAKDDPEHYKMRNIHALKSCLQLLTQSNRALCVFLEGTSGLGHRHLPFEKGAARLGAMCLKAKQPAYMPQIMPLSVFYDDPTHLGGRAYVLYGKGFPLPQGASEQDLHTLFSAKLEEILCEYDSEAEQELCHFVAALLSHHGAYSYIESLFSLSVCKGSNPTLFDKIIAQAKAAKSSPALSRVIFYKQTPLYPKSPLLSLWVASICALPVGLGFTLNALPLLCGFIAARLMAKEKHTISLWRVIVGFGMGFVWWGAVMCGLGIYGGIQGDILEGVSGVALGLCEGMVACGVSLWGLHLYGAFKKHSIALLNLCLHAKGYGAYKELFQNLARLLDSENSHSKEA